MTPWICDCHGKPMLWQIDTRMRRGGRWECREKRREYNAKRIRVFGQHYYAPNEEDKQFIRHLRDERKEQRGRT